MTGKESGHINHSAAQAVPHINPDALEVAPGTAHENLEGWIPQLATDDEIRVALEGLRLPGRRNHHPQRRIEN